MRIGFIGLGTMGASMAANLQKGGYDLVVHDLRRASADRHVAAGATWAGSPQEVAAAVDVLFSSLPGPKEVEDVAVRPDGVLAGIRPDAAWFDLTTNSPTMVRKLHGLLAEKGAHMMDAPVSGGPRGAASGKLALWVGGDQAVFDRHKAVLDAIGDQARYVGPIGAGSVAKLVHNCAGYAVQAVYAEVFTMGVKGGVEPLALWEAVRSGAGGRRRSFDGLVDQFLPNKYARPRARRADAHGQPGPGGDDRGDEPRLERTRFPRRHAPSAGTRRRPHRGPPGAHRRSPPPRSAREGRPEAELTPASSSSVFVQAT